MAQQSMILAGLLATGLLVAPVAAEEGFDPGFDACFDDVDMDAFEARYDVLAAEHDIDHAVQAACDAGDRDKAAALWAALEDDLYAGADGERLRACMEEAMAAARDYLQALGLDEFSDEPHVCDEDF